MVQYLEDEGEEFMAWVAFRTLSNFPRLLKLLEHTRCWILPNRIGRNLRRSWNREKTFHIRNIFLCISHICFPNIFLIKKFDSFEKYNAIYVYLICV